jgi:hypothetical protein
MNSAVNETHMDNFKPFIFRHLGVGCGADNSSLYKISVLQNFTKDLGPGGFFGKRPKVPIHKEDDKSDCSNYR